MHWADLDGDVCTFPGSACEKGAGGALKLRVTALAVLHERPRMAHSSFVFDSEDPRVALMASNSVLDRLFGKPAQTVDVKVQTTDIGAVHLQVLQEVAKRRKERLASSPQESKGNYRFLSR